MKKLICLLAIVGILTLTVMPSSVILAENNEQIEETSENGGGIENKNVAPHLENNDIEEETISEEEVVKEEAIVEQEENKNIEEANQNSTAFLKGAISRSVGQTFTVETDGVQVNYTVLTEDANLKTGTVKVGTKDTTNGNGIVNQATPTNNTLTIPETVTNGNFTYTVTELQKSSFRYIRIDQLNLPSSLRKVGPDALAGMGNEKMVIPEGVTHIGDHCFGENTSLRVLKLPSTLETLGSSILGVSGPSQQVSVYYPYKKTITYSSEGGSNKPFFAIGAPSNGNKQTLIITENAEQYNKIKADKQLLFTPTGYDCLTYEVPMEFYDKEGNEIVVDKEVTKLYAQDILWEKQKNDIWDSKFTSLTNLNNGNITVSGFPTLPDEQTLGYKANYWGVDQLAFTTIDRDGKVKISDTMGSEALNTAASYVMSPRIVAVEEELKISFETLDQVYDGSLGVRLILNREKVNDQLFDKNIVQFRFWLVDKNHANTSDYTKQYSLWSISKNNLLTGLKNVADSGKYVVHITYMDKRITDKTYLWETIPFYNQGATTLTVDVRPNDLDFNLQVDEIEWSNQTSLPDEETMIEKIGLNGTFEWETGQSPKIGTHTYNYTFTPDNFSAKKYVDKTTSPVTKDNFTKQEKKGSVEITYKVVVEHSVTFVDKDNNVIEVKKVEEGKDVVAPQVPEVIGYTFDGWDKALTNITSDTTIKALYKANKYTLKFDGNGGSNGKDIIKDYNTPIGDLDNSIREGYRFIGWFTQKVGGVEVTKDTKMPLNGATYYAQWEVINPGDLIIDVENDTPIEVPLTKEEIKDAVLTEKEKQEYLSGTDINIKVVVKRIPETTDNIVKDALNGRKDGAYFDIAIYKKVGNQAEVKVNALNKTMRFVIDVPEELYATKGVTRVFEVMRIHDGKIDFLKDLDLDDKTVTIETDRFSTYVLCYKDSSSNETKPSTPNEIKPSNPTKPSSPDTGDTTNIALWSLMLLTSIGVVMGTSAMMRRNKKEK